MNSRFNYENRVANLEERKASIARMEAELVELNQKIDAYENDDALRLLHRASKRTLMTTIKRSKEKLASFEKQMQEYLGTQHVDVEAVDAEIQAIAQKYGIAIEYKIKSKGE